MSELDLDRETLHLLQLGREARTPSAADRARVRQRLADAAGIALAEPAAIVATASATTGEQPAVAPEAHRARRAGGARLVFGSAAAAWILGGVCAASAMVGGLLVAASIGQPEPAPRSSQAARVPVVAAKAPVAPAHEEPTVVVETAVPAAVPDAHDPEAAEAPRAARKQRAAAPASDPLIAELQLLHRARSAWQHGSAARALALLDQHRARYGASAVAVERDALRVLCLCDLGRVGEATRLGKRWLQRAEQSPLRGAVTQSCVFE